MAKTNSLSEASFASLSATLLARKGGAKPAMRPQSALPVAAEDPDIADHDDLGWNDMGDEASFDAASQQPLLLEKPNQIVPITPETISDVPAPNQVRESLDRIATQLVKTAKTGPHKRKRTHVFRQGKRAAFTLRIDHERHLQLRLACTLRGCSAQQLVTEALDRMLADMPEVTALAAQVKRDSK